MADIAYLGLGLMGRGMVRNLLQAGHRVHAWNRSAAELPEEIASHPALVRAALVAGYGELQANALHKLQFRLVGIEAGIEE